ncbi:MAG TPA: CBS domain-containing protein [Anaerolineales bacterium]|nr:CBS domain-containing protein [Anaerolineales bacterium]
MYATVKVKQILDRKGRQVWSIDPETTVFEALRFMAEKNIGAAMVMSGGEIAGIFSERDYARKVVLEGRSERETRVREVMTSRVIGVGLHDDIERCLVLMTGKFIRHLPVVDEDDRIAGVISIGDVVKELIAEQSFVIDQLAHYVTGDMPKPLSPDKTEAEL